MQEDDGVPMSSDLGDGVQDPDLLAHMVQTFLPPQHVHQASTIILAMSLVHVGSMGDRSCVGVHKDGEKRKGHNGDKTRSAEWRGPSGLPSRKHVFQNRSRVAHAKQPKSTSKTWKTRCVYIEDEN